MSNAKKWIPTKEILEQLEHWASEGMTEGSMAKAVGLKPNTFSLKKRDFPEMGEAINRGKQDDEALCMNRLRMLAFDDKFRGNLTALIFYGKVRFGWNDRQGQNPQIQLPKGIMLKSKDD